MIASIVNYYQDSTKSIAFIAGVKLLCILPEKGGTDATNRLHCRQRQASLVFSTMRLSRSVWMAQMVQRMPAAIVTGIWRHTWLNKDLTFIQFWPMMMSTMCSNSVWQGKPVPILKIFLCCWLRDGVRSEERSSYGWIDYIIEAKQSSFLYWKRTRQLYYSFNDLHVFRTINSGLRYLRNSVSHLPEIIDTKPSTPCLAISQEGCLMVVRLIPGREA